MFLRDNSGVVWIIPAWDCVWIYVWQISTNKYKTLGGNMCGDKKDGTQPCEDFST